MSGKAGLLFQRMLGSTLSPFWSTMSRNWMLKLMCVGLAFIVWQGVSKSNSHEVDLPEIPVTVSAGDDFAVLDLSTDVVKITFRGSEEKTQVLSRDQVSVELNITDYSSLRQTLTFTARNVKAPSGVRAVSFDPAEVTVKLDREVNRVLPVKASLTGTLPEGIQMEQFICDPATVRVRGAESLLKTLEMVRTDPIRMDGRYQTFKTHVNIASDGQAWSASPDRVSVQLVLNEYCATRTVEGCLVRPMLASGVRRVVTIRPEQVDVVLKGAPERIEAVGLQDLVTYVECTDLADLTEYEASVRVDLPPGVEVEQIEPSVVQVTVTAQ